MNKRFTLLLFIIGLSMLTFAQEKKITIEEIYQGAFRTSGLDVLRSMKNGEHYTVLNSNRSTSSTSIDKYDYKTLEKVETIVNSHSVHIRSVKMKVKYFWLLRLNRYLDAQQWAFITFMT